MLLLMKGLTSIPFARKAAALITLPATYTPDYSSKEISFWGKVVHFENRYWSIDQLLRELPVTNILELSSGFSFRGLQYVIDKPVYYIDTDLPDLITTKKGLLENLQADIPVMKGTLETLPLNALDEAQFAEVTSHFPPGPVVVVNEGLLMYLGKEEKEKVCGLIHDLLKARGGYWITADIYIKNQLEQNGLREDAASEFFKAHRIEENKFESFEDAGDFFAAAGFELDKMALRDREKLSTLQYLVPLIPEQQLGEWAKRGTIQKTWRLKAV